MLFRSGVAAVREFGPRRPIVGFAVRDEVCCAMPALLHQPAAWDGVAVVDSMFIAIPADRFAAAVGERWADQWATRTLSWLVEIGARAADMDGTELPVEVAALLLRHRDGTGIVGCAGALADVLDVDENAIRRVLADLRRLGAIRLTGRRVCVTQPKRLQGIITAGRRVDAPALPCW